MPIINLDITKKFIYKCIHIFYFIKWNEKEGFIHLKKINEM